MELLFNGYRLKFADGGVEVFRNESKLYYNKRPIFVNIKTYLAVTEFHDGVYEETVASGDGIIASGKLVTPSGSSFFFEDTYTVEPSGIKVDRKVRVDRAEDDLGFSSKISFVMAASDQVPDYNCFAPGVWYKQNEFAPEYAMGKDLECEYFWYPETGCALPMFAMQHIATGETAAISRWASNVTMRNTDIEASENRTDRSYTIDRKSVV